MNKMQSSVAKNSPLFLFEQLRVTKRPWIRPILPESRNNKGQNELLTDILTDIKILLTDIQITDIQLNRITGRYTKILVNLLDS